MKVIIPPEEIIGNEFHSRQFESFGTLEANVFQQANAERLIHEVRVMGYQGRQS